MEILDLVKQLRPMQVLQADGAVEVLTGPEEVIEELKKFIPDRKPETAQSEGIGEVKVIIDGGRK